MEPVELEAEESAEECTCEPFYVVRYRNPTQEPSFVHGVTEVNYYGNDDWLVLIGLDGVGEEVELFIARQNEVLSVELVS